MASNLDCIGLGVADRDALGSLLNQVRPQAVALGRVAGLEIVRWQDASGARLVIGIGADGVVDLLPSLASETTTRLANLRRANEAVAVASVVDEDGEQLTSLALELEQIRLLADAEIESASGAIVCLGQDMTVHASAEAFGGSSASLLDPNSDTESDPPPHYEERGLKWPPRVGAQSFISYGVFGAPEEAEPGARLAGIVSDAEVRTNTATGQTFIVATVDTALFQLAVCLSTTEHESAPEPGQVVAGTGFLVGSLPQLEAMPRRKGWWRRG